MELIMKPEMTFKHQPDNSIRTLDIPQEERRLAITSYDYTVAHVISLIEKGQIILEMLPNDSLWNVKKSSVLIESLLINFPIPPFYFSEQENGKWLVIDGTQRLSALFNFCQKDYQLKGLTILSEFEDKRFNEFRPYAKRLINYSIIRIILIGHNSHPAMLHNVMKRLK